MRNHAGADGPTDGEEGRQGNLFTLLVRHVNRRQALRGRAADVISLDIDPAHLSLLEGVVDVGTTEIDREDRHRRAEIDIQRGHLLPINVDLVLGSLGRELGSDAIQHRIAVAGLDDLLGAAEKLLERIHPIALIQQLEFEATAGAIARDRRGLDHKDAAAIDGGCHRPVEAFNDGPHGVVLTRPLIPMLHADEEQALVRSIAVETSAAEQSR